MQFTHSFYYLRTDKASFLFCRQRIVQFLSPRTDSASWRSVAAAIAGPGAIADFRYRFCTGYFRQCRFMSASSGTFTVNLRGKRRTALPDHQPRMPLPGDASDGACRRKQTPAGGESVGPARHSGG